MARPQNRTRVPLHAGIVIGCVLMIAACATRAPATLSASASPSAGAPRLAGTISVNGGVTLTSRFSSTAQIDVDGTVTPAPTASTCADFARGMQPDPAAFAAPTVETAGDTTVYLRATIAAGYRGAGTYTSRSNPALTGTLVYGSGMGTGQSGVFTVFRSSIHGNTTLTVAADGSGMLEFSDWGSDEYKGGKGTVDVSGTVTWRCR